jgi:hypothetical protein
LVLGGLRGVQFEVQQKLKIVFLFYRDYSANFKAGFCCVVVCACNVKVKEILLLIDKMFIFGVKMFIFGVNFFNILKIFSENEIEI